jgi:hypothetical protein
VIIKILDFQTPMFRDHVEFAGVVARVESLPVLTVLVKARADLGV